MKLSRTITTSGAALALFGFIGLAACSADQATTEGTDNVSIAALPVVQASGVSRIATNVQGNVTNVDLLDESGQRIGNLVLEKDGIDRVHAKTTLRGQTLDATWTKEELSFSHDGGDRITLRAKEKVDAALDEPLSAASDLLNVATYVAAQVRVFSPVSGDAVATSNGLRPLEWGTGCSGERRYQGSASTWSSSAAAVQQCYQSSNQAAFQTCLNGQGGGGTSCYGSNTSSSTTVTPGYFTGYTCTTTITVRYNCQY